MARAAHLLRYSALLTGLALAGATPVAAQSRPAAAAPVAGLIDLNSATRDELMALDGIGEVRADAIIRARPFKTKAELAERWIVPEPLYEKIADKVTVRPLPAAATPGRPAAPPAKR